MEMKNGKIDFIENKKAKGTKNPITAYYTLIFSKDISYKTVNKKINIHFFNEQDSILYIVDDDASYLIDYKKREVIINERDVVIFMIRKNYLFANFYANQAGGNLLLMGRIRDSLKTDFSTTISASEQKIFTEMYNLQSKTSSLEEKLFCYDKYEFRNKDTLLIQYTSKISNPYNYEKGTIIEFETKLLYAILDDQEYEKPYYYDYAEFCNDDFHFYDKRKSLVVDDYIYHNENLEKDDKSVLQALIAENNENDIYSSNFLELENGMMSLYMQVKKGQQQIAVQKAEWQKVTDVRIFNMNLYTLPAKYIEPVPYREMEMVNVPLTFPLVATEIIEDEYLTENQEKITIVDEIDFPSESINDIVADTVVLLTEIKFEDSLSEEIVEENPVDIVELDAEEIVEEDFVEDKMADVIFSDEEIENIILKEAVLEEFPEEDIFDIVELDTEDIVIEEIISEEIVEEEIEDIVPELETGNIFIAEILKEEKTAGLISDMEIGSIVFEEIVEEEFEEIIPELETEDIFVEEIILEEPAKNEIIDTVISESLVEMDIIEVDFDTLKIDKLHVDTIALAIFPDEVTEDTLNITGNKEIASLESPVIIEDVKVEVIFLEPSSEKDSIPEALKNEPMYYIVLNYFKDMENAKAFFNDKKKLYNNLTHLGKDLSSDTFMVGIGPYQTEDDIRDRMENLRISGVRGWILKQ